MSKTTFSLRFVLEKDKLNGSNFLDWYRNLRIVLKQERKDYVLEKALPEKLGTNVLHAEYDAWKKHYDDVVDVCGLMLATMDSDLRSQHENMESPIEMITNLKLMFLQQTRVERHQTVKSLIECKLPHDAPVKPHVSKMMGYIDNLRRLDSPISLESATEIILQSLPSSFDQFVKDYIKNGLTKTLTELHDMLITAQLHMKKETPHVLRVQKDKGFKKPGKDKSKAGVVQTKSRDRPKPRSRSILSPEDKCCYCKERGHWKRDCNKFVEDQTRVMMESESSSSAQGIDNCKGMEEEQVEVQDRNEAEAAALAVAALHL